MKPKDIILDTDFYQLASDGYVEVSLNIPIGSAGMGSSEMEFRVGSSEADFIVNSYDSLSGEWGAGATRQAWTDKERIDIAVTRENDNRYKLKAAVQYATSVTSVTVKARVKTFMWPEAS